MFLYNFLINFGRFYFSEMLKLLIVSRVENLRNKNFYKVAYGVNNQRG